METPPNVPVQNNNFIKKWSWSAFLGTWLFLFANKQYKLGVKFFLFFLVLNFLFYAPWLDITNFATIGSSAKTLQLVFLGVSIWLGIQGQEIVWKSGVWKTQEEFLRKQKFAGKLIVIYFIVFTAISIFSFILVFKPYIEDPILLDQKVMSEALMIVQKRNKNIDTIEFENGYHLGIKDGQNIEVKKSFIADQSSSYQEGYRSGYAISCAEKYNQTSCFKKLLE